MNDRLVRASEIGTFAFCQRAWWFASQGRPSENVRALQAGARSHRRFGRLLSTAALLRGLAYASFGLALVLVALRIAHG